MESILVSFFFFFFFFIIFHFLQSDQEKRAIQESAKQFDAQQAQLNDSSDEDLQKAIQMSMELSKGQQGNSSSSSSTSASASASACASALPASSISMDIDFAHLDQRKHILKQFHDTTQLTLSGYFFIYFFISDSIIIVE